MNKWMTMLMVLTLLYIMIIPVVALADGQDTEDTSGDSEINISLSPSDVLFDINNMKPGDWAPRTIVVQNSGIMNFSYQMSLQNEGADKLFNELLLEISDGDNELYHGKLADFEKLPLRKLAAAKEEELAITVRFPEHLGNEFQGTDSQFTLIFTAEGMEGKGENEVDEQSVAGAVSSDGNSSSGDPSSGGSGSGGLPLPNTATNIFNFLIIGALLIIAGSLVVLYNRRKVSE